MANWRCPHCRTPQPEAARCWVCRRSSTSCGTCAHFRRAIAGPLGGTCGLDPRRTALARRRAPRLLAPDPDGRGAIGGGGADPDHRPGGAAVPGAGHALEQAGRLNVRSCARRSGTAAPGQGDGLGGGGAVLSRIGNRAPRRRPPAGSAGDDDVGLGRVTPPCHWMTALAGGLALASATVRPTYVPTVTSDGVGVGRARRRRRAGRRRRRGRTGSATGTGWGSAPGPSRPRSRPACRWAPRGPPATPGR